MEKFILFGCGRYGQKAYDMLHDRIKIVCFCDNDQQKWGRLFNNKKIIPPSELPLTEECGVVITVAVHAREIEQQLRNSGVSKIYLFIMFYDATTMEEKAKLLNISRTTWFTDCFFKDNSKRVYHRQDVYTGKSFFELKSVKKVLMISYLFPPTGGAGVQRTLKYAKYLPEFGYDVTICTRGYTDYNYPHDVTLLDEVPLAKIVRIQEEPSCWQELSDLEQQDLYNLYYGIVESKSWMNKYKEIVKDLDRKLVPDESILWVLWCLKELELNIDMLSYDIVYTTSAPYSSHILGFYLKKYYGVPWIADFRDPWCCNDDFNNRFAGGRIETLSLEKELEKSLRKASDKVIAACLIDNEASSDVQIITNGYDESDFADVEVEPLEQFTICYNGRMYEEDDSNAVLLLEILNGLMDEGRIPSKGVQWIINGQCNENLLKEHDRHGILKINGSISHKESVKTLLAAHLLVLFGGYGKAAEYIWRGKMFEYFRSMRPILSFSSPYGVQFDSIKELGQGITVQPSEKNKIESFILNIYCDFIQNESKWGNAEIATKYDRKSLTRDLADLFDSIIEGYEKD